MSRTTKMARGLLLLYVFTVVEGAVFAWREGMGAPLRIRRDMRGGTCALQRPSSQSRRLSNVGEEVNRPLANMHAADDTSVYEPVHRRVRRWSATPVMAPPLLTDPPHWERTYIKTKLYPSLSF